jgi:carbonic anhydrase/acetyltransferase-like protein (isoleucine patch superfamily)
MAHNLLSYRDKYPRVADSAMIAPTAVVVGDVVIGEESSIWFGCIIRADVNEIRIGPRSNIQDASVVHVAKEGQGTYIGANVTIGHMALLHACTLEDGCLIGMRATLMDNCVVEEGAMVAAGALVTPGKRVRRGELWAGAPAKLIRTLTSSDRAAIAKLAPRYVGLAAEYRAMDPEAEPTNPRRR